MKLRIIYSTLLVLLSTMFVHAQKGGNFSVGGSLGLSYMLAQNTYYLNGNAKELDYKPKFSYHAFLQGGYNPHEEHGIFAYLNYCAEGQKYKDEFQWKLYPQLRGVHEKYVDFKYMGLGVLYRFTPLLSGQKQQIRTDVYHWRMKLLVGFELDFLLNAQMKYYITNPGGTRTQMPYPIDPSIGGYPGYTPNSSTNYTSYFQRMQGVGVIRFGFDYVFDKNVYIGVAFEAKAGLNDINAKAYRVHPDYKKSKNYFFGLNLEVGYTMNKNKKKDEKTSTANKKKKTSSWHGKSNQTDRNNEVDEVDKKTRKRLGK